MRCVARVSARPVGTVGHRYVYPNLDGARVGATLLDECLKELDPELHDFLHQKQMHAELCPAPNHHAHRSALAQLGPARLHWYRPVPCNV